MTRRRTPIVLVAAAGLALAGCSSHASGPAAPKIGAARVFRLGNFRPVGPVQAGKPFRLSFAVYQPSGAVLRTYRSGPGPHTGVHVIAVSEDLQTIVHRHPPVAADGRVSLGLTFPRAGPYRVLVDVYPRAAGVPINFQLYQTIRVRGPYHAQQLPPPGTKAVVDGYTFQMTKLPKLRAIQPAFLTVHVTGPSGRPARFTIWYGALAHAIFFRARTLDYFHTHVCTPGFAACQSLVGAPIAGKSSAPGVLQVGVLLPAGGTWRLFLQCRVDGRILTAPFTLRVR